MVVGCGALFAVRCGWAGGCALVGMMVWKAPHSGVVGFDRAWCVASLERRAKRRVRRPGGVRVGEWGCVAFCCFCFTGGESVGPRALIWTGC